MYSGVDPGFFQGRGVTSKKQQAFIFVDEKAIDTRSQTSSETSQRGVVATPLTLPLDPPR